MFNLYLRNFFPTTSNFTYCYIRISSPRFYISDFTCFCITDITWGCITDFPRFYITDIT